MARSRWSPPMVALSQRRSPRCATVFGPIAIIAVGLLVEGPHPVRWRVRVRVLVIELRGDQPSSRPSGQVLSTR
eukprot:4714391-Pyramimonas_sp.AAC.1